MCEKQRKACHTQVDYLVYSAVASHSHRGLTPWYTSQMRDLITTAYVRKEVAINFLQNTKKEAWKKMCALI